VCFGRISPRRGLHVLGLALLGTYKSLEQIGIHVGRLVQDGMRLLESGVSFAQ
jgi:hypothetical protein